MKKNKKNYLYNIGYQLFALFVPLITTPYIARTLSVAGIGTYSYTYSMMRYFWLLMAIGTATYGTRLIGICQKNSKERSENFWSIFALKLFLFFCIGAIYLIYVAIYAQNKLIALIQGIYLIGVLFDITWFFQGMEDFGKVALKNFFIKILNVVYIFTCIKGENDLNKYIFGLAFFQLIGNVSMWFSLKKYLIKIDKKNIKPWIHFKESWQLFLPSIATQVFSVIDKSMIGWITGNSTENGYYEQALKIIEMALVLVTTLGTVMLPSISRAFSEKDKEKISKYIDNSIKFTFFMSIPMTLGLIVISDKFVPIFFGEQYIQSSNILKALSALFIVMGLNSVFGTQYLISAKKQNVLTKILFISGIINIVNNFIFIRKYGALGAAIGTFLGELSTLIMELFYLKRTHQYSIKRCLKNLRRYLVASVIMFILLIITQKNVSRLWQLIFSVILGISVYVGMLVILRDDLVMNEIDNVKNKYLKKGEIE